MPSVTDWLRGFKGRHERREPGLWVKCPGCAEMLYRKDLELNLLVCPKCAHHFRMPAADRIASLIDGEFHEIAAELSPRDPLNWADVKTYPQKLAADREKSGVLEAVLAGFGTMGGFEIGLAVMDFFFRGGTMGAVVGEKVALLFEESARRGVPAVVFTASGGARMEEGLIALMQMAKTSAALARLQEARLPYICVLTDPTTGGVSASFAFDADVIIAEPKAVIGFAGRRVIEQTIRQRLPDDFQTAEFLVEHGHADMVVERGRIKAQLIQLLELLHPTGRREEMVS
ncbi:MAG TPA: acetyl-CoA carboxylase, carboxyltransferase subunit beta [Candidatus Dormibacteraeota bacterium]|nr:acetyl-CoA carboxylase, carboxyltransferase subunit beta [Candidatus Dormibacteraeota bacterium]